MSKHTPGPWHIVEDRTPTSLEVFAGKMAIAELWRRLDRHTEMANAKLMAAAPEMLEALIEAVDCGIVPQTSANEGGASKYARQVLAADKIRAAIAAATGETP
jgi:hypothetical protein